MGKNQRVAAAEQLRDYQIRCIQEQCEAEKKEADDLFAVRAPPSVSVCRLRGCTLGPRPTPRSDVTRGTLTTSMRHATYNVPSQVGRRGRSDCNARAPEPTRLGQLYVAATSRDTHPRSPPARLTALTSHKAHAHGMHTHARTQTAHAPSIRARWLHERRVRAGAAVRAYPLVQGPVLHTGARPRVCFKAEGCCPGKRCCTSSRRSTSHGLGAT
jgi:hypothetical protein